MAWVMVVGLFLLYWGEDDWKKTWGRPVRLFCNRNSYANNQEARVVARTAQPHGVSGNDSSRDERCLLISSSPRSENCRDNRNNEDGRRSARRCRRRPSTTMPFSHEASPDDTRITVPLVGDDDDFVPFIVPITANNSRAVVSPEALVLVSAPQQSKKSPSKLSSVPGSFLFVTVRIRDGLVEFPRISHPIMLRDE
eukprot:scaffold74939_cov26-Attheya_sp.AAC.1